MRGYFLSCKAEDEGMLSPGKDDNTAGQEINRKGDLLLEWFGYTFKTPALPSAAALEPVLATVGTSALALRASFVQ